MINTIFTLRRPEQWRLLDDEATREGSNTGQVNWLYQSNSFRGQINLSS